MSVFKKLDTVWCVASDMDRSVEFYKTVLGLTPTYQSPFWSSFDLGGVQLGLHGGEGGKVAGGFVLGFETDDIRACRERAEAAGAQVSPEYHDIPRGVVMDIYDPDGNKLQATQLGVKAADLV